MRSSSGWVASVYSGIVLTPFVRIWPDPARAFHSSTFSRTSIPSAESGSTMDDAGVVGPVDVEAGGVGDDRVALDGRLEARVDLPARGGEADHVRIRALGRPAGHRERREEVDVDRRLRVRGVEEVEGPLPDDLEGDDRPVRRRRARRHRRQVLAGRRQLEVDRGRRQVDEQDVHPREARVRRRRGAPGTLERRVLLRSLDVRDAGEQRSDDGLRLHASRSRRGPDPTRRSNGQLGRTSHLPRPSNGARFSIGWADARKRTMPSPASPPVAASAILHRRRGEPCLTTGCAAFRGQPTGRATTGIANPGGCPTPSAAAFRGH